MLCGIDSVNVPRKNTDFMHLVLLATKAADVQMK